MYLSYGFFFTVILNPSDDVTGSFLVACSDMTQSVSLLLCEIISAKIEFNGTVSVRGSSTRFCMGCLGIVVAFHCSHNMWRVSPHIKTRTLLPAMDILDGK